MHEIVMNRFGQRFHFRCMSVFLKVRDLIYPRINILEEIGIKQGDHVLDYGCGHGSYIIPLSKLVGTSGKIYMVDINPAAVQTALRIAAKTNINNLEGICTDCYTRLPDRCIDSVLLYDVLHGLKDSHGILKEISRILKPTGILSIMDHHRKENEIISETSENNLFILLKKGKKTFSFKNNS